MEVNETTVEEAIKYGQFLKKSEEDIAEAIDIYKTLGNEMFYGPVEDPMTSKNNNNDYQPSMLQKNIFLP